MYYFFPESFTQDTSNKAEQPKASVNNIPKVVDNKRKHMLKILSQSQIDQLLMNTMKEDMLLNFGTITRITTCLTSIGDGIASGMELLAKALTQNQPVHPPRFANPAFYYPTSQAHKYPGQCGGLNTQPYQQLFPNIAAPSASSTIAGTCGAVSAANDTLYNNEGNGIIYSNIQ